MPLCKVPIVTMPGEVRAEVDQGARHLGADAREHHARAEHLGGARGPRQRIGDERVDSANAGDVQDRGVARWPLMPVSSVSMISPARAPSTVPMSGMTRTPSASGMSGVDSSGSASCCAAMICSCSAAAPPPRASGRCPLSRRRRRLSARRARCEPGT